MRIPVIKPSGKILASGLRNMSGSISYAAAVSTPNGTLRQPQIQARACSDPDLRASFEAKKKDKLKPQRPGAGIRSRTSFRGWTKNKDKIQQESSSKPPGPVEEIRHSAQFPRAEHQPNTERAEDHVYVLTLKISDSLAHPMNDLRRRYFPKHLNRTPAHLTLFHALPHSQLQVLEAALSQSVSTVKAFAVSTGKPFRMRRGVGVNVDAGYQTMKNVHAQLRAEWLPFLSEQDAGGFRPHWTVMNKVDEEGKVEEAFETVRGELSARCEEGEAMGLELWRYERGNWEWVREYVFGEGATQGAESSSSVGKSEAAGEKASGKPKRPGMWTRGSSVGDALRSMSFRKNG